MADIKTTSLGERGGEALPNCHVMQNSWMMIKTTRLGHRQRSKKLKEDEFGTGTHFHRGSHIQISHSLIKAAG